MSERLDKWICERTTYTRKTVKEPIKSGKVSVNGVPVTDPGMQVRDADAVTLAGESLDGKRHLYIMLHKPPGVVSVSEAAGEITVLDLLPDALRRKGLFPAGRLDKDTTGFVLITNDGDFAHRILSPKRHVTKIYRVTLRDPAQPQYAEAFVKGLALADGTVCLSAELTFTDDPRCVIVALREGRYHQVKRMFAALGNAVTALHRTQIGALSLDSALREGECRCLTDEEVRKIQTQTTETED